MTGNIENHLQWFSPISRYLKLLKIRELGLAKYNLSIKICPSVYASVNYIFSLLIEMVPGFDIVLQMNFS
ncbi:MAG: hypothetical protein DA405_11485 [Bacteroidetes bacterium]|nr:MAG: hypothetical protein DA405_11485 [Bacteroidota bacterium]